MKGDLDVSVVPCDSYSQQEIDKAIGEALNKIDFQIKPNSKILIKPNLVSQNTPEQGSITHYTLIDSLCRYFKDKECKVTIGESSSFYIKGYTMRAYETSKILDVAKKYSVPLIAFENEKIIPVPKKKLKFLDELYLPEIINDFDLIVDVPKLKTHQLMRFSGALKNLYGIPPGGYKQLLHMKTKNINEFAEVLLDVYENINPKILSVMDAVVGLDGGPAAVIGKPKKIGYVLASMNPIALDVIACQIIGYSPENITTITMAEKRKLIDVKKVHAIGEFKKIIFEKLQKGPVADLGKDSPLITRTYALPRVTSKCNLCGNCVPRCPTGAFEIKDNKLNFYKEKCIACYSCVPICPVKAIKLKEFKMNKFFTLIRRIFRI
ncbi:MAG: DUF362 domain-containing protein [Candidatus Pacearchaeota archaeon]|nr:DUF362 domain-containing protein [Candidatus Pacearchaeota archaeon]